MTCFCLLNILFLVQLRAKHTTACVYIISPTGRMCLLWLLCSVYVTLSGNDIFFSFQHTVFQCKCVRQRAYISSPQQDKKLKVVKSARRFETVSAPLISSSRKELTEVFCFDLYMRTVLNIKVYNSFISNIHFSLSCTESKHSGFFRLGVMERGKSNDVQVIK
ncbi:hypothetical protein BD560DRAFT_429191 [Blakeslea trispora]|nr:hypothetical protein BD560DRAFT_429191 [Blakeslea trispora]